MTESEILAKRIYVQGHWRDSSGVVVVQQNRGPKLERRRFNSDGRFSCAEELEVFAALVTLLAVGPDRSVGVHFVRDTTVRTWRQLASGEGVLPTNDKTVQRVRSRTRDWVSSVVVIENAPADWNAGEVERRLQADFDDLARTKYSVVGRALVTLAGAREQRRNAAPPRQAPQHCACEKIDYKSKLNALLVLSQADSQFSMGKAPQRAYKCPTSGAWHLTSKKR